MAHGGMGATGCFPTFMVHQEHQRNKLSHVIDIAIKLDVIYRGRIDFLRLRTPRRLAPTQFQFARIPRSHSSPEYDSNILAAVSC